MNRLASMPLLLLSGLLIAMGVAAPASAHTQLVGVDPAEGTTVTAGESVTLTFSEDLLTIGAEASVTDSAGVATALEVTFPTPAAAQVVLPDMAAGDVSLAWRIVATDGHPIEGSLGFAVEGSDTPTAGTTVSPRAATPSPSSTPPATATADPSASGDKGDGEGGFPVVLVIALVASLLTSAAAILVSKRRR